MNLHVSFVIVLLYDPSNVTLTYIAQRFIDDSYNFVEIFLPVTIFPQGIFVIGASIVMWIFLDIL